MDAGYHFLYLVKFGLCLFLGATIGTLFIDIDHFIPQVLFGQKCGYGACEEDLWLHNLYWPTIILGVALGMFLHLLLDHINHGCDITRWI